MTGLPKPRRPNVEDKHAQRILEWADVAAYVFWVGFLVACGVLAIIHSGAVLDARFWMAIRP